MGINIDINRCIVLAIILSLLKGSDVESNRKFREANLTNLIPKQIKLEIKALTGRNNIIIILPSVDGTQFHLQLHLSRELIGKSFEESLINEFSSSTRRATENFGSILSGGVHYEGKVQGIDESWCAISMNPNKISGIVFDGNQTFTVDEIKTQNLISIALKPLSNDPTSKTKCNVDLRKSKPQPQIPEALSERPKRKATSESFQFGLDRVVASGWLRYVEVWLVVDYKMMEQFGTDKERIKNKCISIMNLVNGIMNRLLIKTILKGIKFLERPEPEHDTRNHIQLLKNFLPIRRKLFIDKKYHDYTIFLSGQNFDDNTVGYAYVGAMCGKQSAAIVQHYPKNVDASLVAMIVGHEMGHTLGVGHDDHKCGNTDVSDRKSIMSKSGIESAQWSNCSLIYLTSNIDRFSCLRNIPSTSDTSFASCGNGVVDHGEQCDCGTPQNCANNTCCDPRTCTLSPHAVCATGLCCDLKTCSLLPTGTECRTIASECDLPEYCSGKTETCPEDVFKYNGFPCHEQRGSCLKGACGSLDLFCKRAVSPSAREAENEYLRRHNLPLNDNCKDVMCLPHLHLHDEESRKLMFVRGSYFTQIPLLRYLPESTDGLSCAVNKTCLNQRCIDLTSLNQGKTCPGDCSGHGTCNSVGNCHCDIPFAPLDCQYFGFGGSVDSGHATNPQDFINYKNIIYFLFLGVVPLLALVFCFWINIKEVFDTKYQDVCAEKYPLLSRCLETCLFPCMSFLSRWLCHLGSKKGLLKPVDSSAQNIDDLKDIRKTICQVDMNVQPPEAEVRSWGVASDALMTDVITVTPKGSPASSRKIRLPSSSPILRTKSYEDLASKVNLQHENGPKKSSSKDSGKESLGANFGPNDLQGKPSYKVSMGSLISIFLRYGRQASRSSDKSSSSTTINSQSQDPPPRELNLRRVVVDPYLSLRAPKTGSKRPEFLRSLSTDPKVTSKALPPSKLAVQNPPNLHGSEQHLHFMTSHKGCITPTKSISHLPQSNTPKHSNESLSDEMSLKFQLNKSKFESNVESGAIPHFQRKAPQPPSLAKPTSREAPPPPSLAKPTARKAPPPPPFAKPTPRTPGKHF